MADLLKDATQRRADIPFERHHSLDLGGIKVQMWVVGPTYMKPKLIVPAHGETGDESLIAANRAVMKAIQDRAGALKTKGVPVDVAAKMVQTDMRQLHPTWPRSDGLFNAARAAYIEAP